MTWHFLEVWLFVTIVFVVGCFLGAWLYGILADSRLAVAQGIVADAVGDVFDRVKARLGVGPVWRPVHLRQMERRPLPVGDSDDDVEDEREGEATGTRIAEPPPVLVRPAASAQVSRPRTPLVRPLATDARTFLPEAVREPARPAGNPPRVASTPVEAADSVVPARPAGLSAPRGGVPDNLQRIKGIGKRNETLLNKLGIFHFGQVAAWTPGEMRWIGQYLAFPERIERDDWVGQAIALAMGSDTGFAKSAERRRERRRQQREFKARMSVAAPLLDDATDNDAETMEPLARVVRDLALAQEADDALAAERRKPQSPVANEPGVDPDDGDETEDPDRERS